MRDVRKVSLIIRPHPLMLPDYRPALVNEAKVLHSECPDAPDSMDWLPDFVVLRLAAGPVESDMVHELLAYLAERMIDIIYRV